MSDKQATVSIVRAGVGADAAQVDAAVRQAVELAGGLPECVRPGALVLLKPNMVVIPADQNAGICTHAEVTKAVADLVAERGATPVVAEASAPSQGTLESMRIMGYELLTDAGYELVDLNAADTVRLPLSGSRLWTELDTFELAQRADAIISLPVLKMHCQATFTCAIKNMMGLATGPQKHAFHYNGLWDSLVDINLLHKPCFAVVDGLLAMEGLGPTTGQVLEKGLILAGSDLVAVDATGARVMGLDPLADVQTIARAQESGLGVAEADAIAVVGEALADVAFDAVRPEDDPNPAWDSVNAVFGERTPGCLSCYTSLGSALLMAVGRDKLGAMAGRTYIIGDAPIPEGVDPADVVPIGRCCGEALQALPRWVRGCVPRSNEILEASE